MIAQPLTRYRMSSTLCAAFLLGVVYLESSHAQPNEEDLTFLQNWMVHSEAENGLYHHFLSQALELLEERASAIAAISSASEWRARQEYVRGAIAEGMGAFPERTPLNVRVLGSLDKDSYRVEKIVYESQPSFFATAAVFLPKGLNAPAPAIVFCAGHYPEAFRNPAYQLLILNLVKKGFVVLAYDPIGQGERLQYLDRATGASHIGYPTHEHSYPGGPQDAEQNLFHAIARGLDHADFLEVRAPKPTLIVATTRDFFNITGTRESVAEAKRTYEALVEQEYYRAELVHATVPGRAPLTIFPTWSKSSSDRHYFSKVARTRRFLS